MRLKHAFLFTTLLISACGESEHWPEHKLTDEIRAVGTKEKALYVKSKFNPDEKAQEYVAGGDYMNYGKTMIHRDGPNMKIDEQGAPMVMQGGKFYYGPGTVAIAALAAHGRMLAGEDKAKFLSISNKLAELQDKDGALRYPFTFRHYSMGQYYKVGWTSGMDQGMALSVYSRAYKLTGDKKWLDYGEKALAFLQVKYPDGPMSDLRFLDKSLAGRAFFLEYPAEPNAYTLNGYIFTLFGLYDWWKVTDSSQAGKLFNDGVDTLEHLLPYYDIGTFSAYDLSYITNSQLPYLQPRMPHVAARYHSLHISQLMGLYSITGKEIFPETANRWRAYAHP